MGCSHSRNPTVPPTPPQNTKNIISKCDQNLIHQGVVDTQDPCGFIVDPSRKKKQQQQPQKTTHKNQNEDPWEFFSRITKEKLLDASDVKDVESAKREIKAIRQYAKQLMEHLQEVNLMNSTALNASGHDNSALGGMNKSLVWYSYHDDEPEEEKYQDKHVRRALYDKQDFSSFKKEKSFKSDEIRTLIHNAIRKNVLFEHHSEEEMWEIVDVFKQASFKMDVCVIEQGGFGNHFYVVGKGKLNFLINVEEEGGSKCQVTIGTYGKGDTFGESALILGPHPTTITAITDCELWSIERQTYRCVISQLHYNQHEEKMAFFRECELNERAFTEIFDSAQIEDLALAAKNDSFDEGTPIIREGEPSDVFYFVRSGFVNTYKKGINPGLGDLAFTIPAKRAFGTTTLLKGTVSPYSYVAKTKVRVYYITKDSFELMLGTLQNALDGNTISRSVTREQSRKTFKDATTMIADRIHDHLELKDLTFYNMLGRGAFGRVTLVQSKQDKALFALKSQQKHYIVSKKQQEHVLNEYKIMKTIGHDPNILGIHNVMQNERYLYFLVDLLPGGELMDYLKRDRKFPESTAKFYSASVILAFERLHSESIAYRDLKPENIVLDKDGYGVLVDFGLAKQIEEGQTYTLCGTPDYFAPEIIQSLGHDWGVDYWELGIFLFETVCGRAPFYDRSLTRRYKKILKGYSYVNIPSGLLCEALGDLISHLLVADQSKRLGRIRDGIQGIKSHRFFAGFDWEGLQERRIPPPFKPSLPQDIKTLGKKNCSTFDDSMVPMSDWNPDLKTLEGWL